MTLSLWPLNKNAGDCELGRFTMRFRLPQTLVYWPPIGDDGFGRPKYGTPVQYPCRWEDGLSETISSDGDVVYSSATAYLAVTVNPAGVVWLGTLANGPQSPGWLAQTKANPGVREIINVSTIPSLKATQSLVTVKLK